MTARTILVADDDRGVRRFLSDVLERDGWRVVAERDGEGALRTFNRVELDAVILDVLMPGMTGFQVAESIRKTDAGQELPLIFVSGVYRASLHRTDSLRRFHALAYLEKPVVTEELLQTLREHFGPVYPRPSRIIGQVQLTDPNLPAPVPANGRDSITELPEAPPDFDDELGELEALAESDSGAPPAPDVTAPTPVTPSDSGPVEAISSPDVDLADSASQKEQREVELEASSLDPQRARGELSRRAFPRVLHELYRQGATGALFLLRERVKKIVFFRDGKTIHVKSNLLNECLGKVLVRERMISEDECKASLRQMEQTGRLQGTVLIEMGCISPQNLVYGLELQLQVKLYDIFSWSQGEYVFRDQARLPTEVVSLGLSSAGIIYEGIRRKVTRERIIVELDAELDRYLKPTSDPDLRQQPLDLGPEEQAFVNAISGRRTLRDHLEAGLLGRDRAHKLCYALLCAGIVELNDRPHAPAFIDVSTMPAVQISPAVTVPAAAPLTDDDEEGEERPGQAPADLEAQTEAAMADEWADDQSRTDPSAFVPLPDVDSRFDDLDADGEEGAAPVQLQPGSPGQAGAGPSNGHGQNGRARGGASASSFELDFPAVTDHEPEREDTHSLLARLEARRDRAASVEEWLATVVLCLRDASPAEILGNGPTATPEELARAFARLSRRYHPDRTAPPGNASPGHPRRRLLAEEIFQVISRAYESLNGDDVRSASAESRATTMAPGGVASLNQEVLRILSAERQFQLGESLIRERQYEEAVEAFRMAVDLNAHEGEFRAYLGWALFQCAPQDEALVAEAVGHLQEASAITPRLDKPYLFLGYLYKALGKLRDAARQFEKAIEANADCDEAQRELKLLR